MKFNRKKNKKKIGFTLIELLAVIIILGILITIAVVGVSRYINDSRKATYVANAKKYVEGASFKVNAGELGINATDTTYYLPYKMINIEKGGGSPFGELRDGYVVVTYDGKDYDYYWTSSDSQKIGFYLTYEVNLSTDKIAHNIEVDTDTGIGGRSQIVVFNDDGTIKETKEALNNIQDGYDYSASAIDSLFVFDKNTGTIMGVNLYKINSVKCIKMLTDKIEISKTDAANWCSYDQTYLYYVLSQHYTEGELMDVITFNDLNHIVIPESIDGVTVRKIKSINVEFSSLYSPLSYIYIIEIPKTVESINNSAFTFNPFLYNVVNKTGKSFNWDGIVYDPYSYGENSFISGKFNNGNKILYITTSPVSYDLYHIFTLSIDGNLRINNKKGYIIEFLNIDNMAWLNAEIGTNYAVGCCPNAVGAIRIRNNEDVLFSNDYFYACCK